MKLRRSTPTMLAILVVACAHGPMPGSFVYESDVPGDVEALKCLAQSLAVAGFEIEGGRDQDRLVAQRAGSPAFDGGLHSTYVARAYVQGDADPALILNVTILDDVRPEPPRQSGASRLRSGATLVQKQQRAQARVVVKAEFDPMLTRCASR